MELCIDVFSDHSIPEKEMVKSVSIVCEFGGVSNDGIICFTFGIVKLLNIKWDDKGIRVIWYQLIECNLKLFPIFKTGPILGRSSVLRHVCVCVCVSLTPFSILQPIQRRMRRRRSTALAEERASSSRTCVGEYSLGTE